MSNETPFRASEKSWMKRDNASPIAPPWEGEGERGRGTWEQEGGTCDQGDSSILKLQADNKAPFEFRLMENSRTFDLSVTSPATIGPSHGQELVSFPTTVKKYIPWIYSIVITCCYGNPHSTSVQKVCFAVIYHQQSLINCVGRNGWNNVLLLPREDLSETHKPGWQGLGRVLQIETWFQHLFLTDVNLKEGLSLSL